MEDSNSDSEPETFLPDSLFQYQERQREDNHPANMVVTRRLKKGVGGSKKGAPTKRKPLMESDEESVHW